MADAAEYLLFSYPEYVQVKNVPLDDDDEKVSSCYLVIFCLVWKLREPKGMVNIYMLIFEFKRFLVIH